MKKKLLDKIAKKNIKVGVVGLGYVGLPLAVEKQRQVFGQSVLIFRAKK